MKRGCGRGFPLPEKSVLLLLLFHFFKSLEFPPPGPGTLLKSSRAGWRSVKCWARNGLEREGPERGGKRKTKRREEASSEFEEEADFSRAWTSLREGGGEEEECLIIMDQLRHNGFW
jgi:hypothetical protein